MNTTCKGLSYDNQKISNASKVVLLLFLFLFAQIAEAQQVVTKHGRLRVNGNKVVNKNNESISLAGNSLFWSNAGDTADFYNAETVNHLADNWNSDIIRVAMGVKETWDNGTGYIDNPNGQKAKIKKVIDAAIAKGIYVIIDWHTHEAEKYTSQAGAFFKEMAKTYGNNDHIIYEIYNEPIGGYGDSARRNLWNNTIKPYAESVISEIRKEDPDNLIVVGTPYFDQGVDIASENQINDSNVAYALHFYAGARFNGNINNDHTAGGRAKADTAMRNGAALFVTEWGTVDSDGNGAVDRQQTQLWLDWMKDNGVSHANWAISDKNEGASVVSSGRGVNGLRNNQLTTAGDYIKGIIQNNNEGGSGGGGGSTNGLEGLYHFKNVASGKYMDSDGASVKTSNLNNSRDRQWRLVATSNGYYNIDSNFSGRGVLDSNPNRVVFGSGTQPNTPGSTNDDKEWIPEAVAGKNNTYRFKNRFNGRDYLAQKFNASGIEYTSWNGNRAQWELIRIGSSKSEAPTTATSNTINVYPNPSNGEFTIDLGTMESAILQLYNVAGQLVLERSVNNNVTTINVSNQLTAGIYMIHVNGTDTTAFKKLVLQ